MVDKFLTKAEKVLYTEITTVSMIAQRIRKFHFPYAFRESGKIFSAEFLSLKMEIQF